MAEQRSGVVRVHADGTSDLLLSQANAPGAESCLGVATLPAGTVSPDAVRHQTSELMYVAAGRGELRTDAGAVPFAAGDALFIPAGVWHWLASAGPGDLVSVFTFPRPDRPATDSRPVGG